MDCLRLGTTTSYLGSFQAFLNFMTLEHARKNIVPSLDEDVLRVFQNTLKHVKGWRKTVDIEPDLSGLLYQGTLEVHEVNQQIIFKGTSTATSTSTSSSTPTSTSTATSSSTTTSSSTAWPPPPVRSSEADSQDFNESSDNIEDPQTAKEYLKADKAN